MTDFKCKNCEYIFNKFCDTAEDSINASCPRCGSHWVDKYYSPIEPEPFNPFKRLPYSDPPFPPVKYWCDFTPTTSIW